MLSINNYSQEYIDECRSRISVQLSAYIDLISAARTHVGTNDAALASAIGSFEPIFFNNKVSPEISSRR